MAAFLIEYSRKVWGVYLWEVSLLFQLFQQFWSIYCSVWNPCLLKTSSNQFCCPQWNAPWWTATTRVNRALDRGPVIAQGNQTYCDLWIKAIYANCHCNSFSHFRNLRNQDVYKHNFLWRNKKSRFLDFIPSRLSQNLWGVVPRNLAIVMGSEVWEPLPMKNMLKQSNFQSFHYSSLSEII